MDAVVANMRAFSSRIDPRTKIRLKQIGESLAGRRIVDGLYKRICVRRYRSAGVIFVHVPRAGGTSLAYAVVGRRAGHFTAAQIRDAMGSSYAKYFKFAVVRNPFDRLVSAYMFASQGGGSEGAIRPDSKYRSSVFSTFTRFVKEWLVFQDLTAVNVVFRPQYLFIYDQGVSLVDYIGRIERPEEITAVIEDRLGKEVNLDRRNTSERARGYRGYYDKECRHIISRLYAEDLALFEYGF